MEAMAKLDLQDLQINAATLDNLGFGLDVVPLLLVASQHEPMGAVLKTRIQSWREHLLERTQPGPDLPPLSAEVQHKLDHQLRIIPFTFVFAGFLVSSFNL